MVALASLATAAVADVRRAQQRGVEAAATDRAVDELRPDAQQIDTAPPPSVPAPSRRVLAPLPTSPRSWAPPRVRHRVGVRSRRRQDLKPPKKSHGGRSAETVTAACG